MREIRTYGSEGGAPLERGRRRRRPSVGADRARFVTAVVDGRLAGLAAIDERVRASVDDGLLLLRSMGVKVGLMTGDHRVRVRASRLDLDWIEADISPVEKYRAVQRLQAEGRTVLFVGDGVNGAAAMAESDVAVDVAAVLMMTSSLFVTFKTTVSVESSAGPPLLAEVRAIPWQTGALQGTLGRTANAHKRCLSAP